MMKNKKKIITWLLSALLCLSFMGTSFGISYSYLKTDDEIENIFIIGETRTELTEEYEPPAKLEPGIEFIKKPIITNTGNLACFVRMSVSFSNKEMEDECELLGFNNTDWVHNADGYYYYKHILQPGGSAIPLFTGVKVKDLNGQNRLLEFDIIIYCEATQQGEYNESDYINAWA